jgi:hypothetical protein
MSDAMAGWGMSPGGVVARIARDRLATFRLVLLIALCLPGFVAAQGSHGTAKAVAVVYDDSGSMSTNLRWVRANYSLKVLAASLKEDDTLLIVRMSRPQVPELYSRVAGINDVITVLQRQSGVGSGTPYEAISTATNALAGRPESERWLVVISDGGFNVPDQTAVRQDIERALASGIRSAFVLIEHDNNDVAEEWRKKGNATIFDARTASAIVPEIEATAALLNGQSRGGVKLSASGGEIRIDSAFSLRRLSVIRQDSRSAELSDAALGQQTVSASDLRIHRFSPNVPTPGLGLPNEARVYHLRTKDGSVLEAGDGIVTMRFDGETSSMRLKMLPDVAAQFVVELADPLGKPLAKAKNGEYVVCDSSYQVVARLTDDAGKPLTPGRADIASFSVSAEIDGSDQALPIDSGQTRFSREFKVGKPGSIVAISGKAEYPGYFHRTSAPMRVRFGKCTRAIEMKVIGGIDHDGKWHASIDNLERAKSVSISVMLDGKPVPAMEMAKWQFDAGPNGSSFEFRFQDGKAHLRPRPFCCVWWWKEVGPGEFVTPLKVATGSSYDKISAPPNLTFSIDAPSGTWERIRWYGCPFGVLALIISVLWYFVRLWRKSRFRPDARFETEEESLVTGTIHPRLLMLREQCNAAIRWLWPSRAESAELFGIRFTSSGDDVIADGRCLKKEHKIPGWNLDRSRLAASDGRGLPQDEAIMSNNMVMTIDLGEVVKRVRYRL